MFTKSNNNMFNSLNMTKRSAVTMSRWVIAFLILTSISASAVFPQTITGNDGDYSYESVANDPLNARIYKLRNGLKVYLSVNKAEPRINTYIAVKTGRKNDPPNAQGLSHYLEHMLFKGTDLLGTVNYDAEKPLIDSIRAIYDLRKNTTDPKERQRLYRIIDSLSYIASGYAIPNEFDKLIASIGGSGVNAYTSLEETVYMCDIPSSQLDHWLRIEAERFRNPVMRLFHTELEAVYEEKNMSLDDDGDKSFDALWEGLFRKHTYGTQTTLGSVEQLQNPSISEIENYYRARYVPGNMAILLAGDFDPDQAIKLIDKRFGGFEAKDFKDYEPPVEDEISSPIVKTVYGPSDENVTFAYRAGGNSTKDANLLTVIEYILSNGSAGLIDLNLNQSQKVIDAYCYTITANDYSVITFGGKPRQGQTLEDVRDLLMSQIDLVKKGEFADWLIPAVVRNFKVSQIRSFDKNSNRIATMLNSFVSGIPWENYIFNIDTLSRISKEEVVDFANRLFRDNYVIVYKKIGEDPNVVKIQKPPITPVKVNRDVQSEFAGEIMDMPASEVQPEFVDFSSEITELKTESGIPVYYVQNKDNALFSLNIVADAGTANDRRLQVASNFLDYTGAGDLTPEKLREQIYKLAVNRSNSVSLYRTSASLSGLDDSFEEALELFEKIYNEPTGNEQSLEKMVDDILKNRENDKLSKDAILWSGMFSYAKYGKLNPFTNRLTESELRKLSYTEILEIIKSQFSYPQRIYYYGPKPGNELLELLNRYHKTPSPLRSPEKPVDYKEADTKGGEVLVVNYDMQQAEIVFLSRGDVYSEKDAPVVSLFNEYFGGNMSSIVFQELRESKALAYATYAQYSQASEMGKHNYSIAYIGTQADKLPEAMKELYNLIKKMPVSAEGYNSARASILKNIESDRIKHSELLNVFENSRRLGVDHDLRKDIYSKVPDLTIDDVKKFHERSFANRKFSVLVLGDINKLDMGALKKYGDVKILSLKDVFGY